MSYQGKTYFESDEEARKYVTSIAQQNEATRIDKNTRGIGQREETLMFETAIRTNSLGGSSGRKPRL